MTKRQHIRGSSQRVIAFAIVANAFGCASSNYEPRTTALAQFYSGAEGDVVLVDGRAIAADNYELLAENFSESESATKFLYEARNARDARFVPRLFAILFAGGAVAAGGASLAVDAGSQRNGFVIASGVSMLGAIVLEALQFEDRRRERVRRRDAINVFNAHRLEKAGVSRSPSTP